MRLFTKILRTGLVTDALPEQGREAVTLFVGMDVHKESMDLSVAEDGWHGEVRHWAQPATISRVNRR